MSLCYSKEDENLKYAGQVLFGEGSVKLKKDIDSSCNNNNDCMSGVCEPPKQCDIILKNSYNCNNIKVCQVGDNLVQISNFAKQV